MSSCRKKISEKTAIANRLKQMDKVAPFKRTDEIKAIEHVHDVCAENGTAALIVTVDSECRMEMTANFVIKPKATDYLARVLASIIIRVSSEVEVSTDWFIGNIVERVGYLTEALLSGEILKRMEEKN